VRAPQHTKIPGHIAMHAIAWAATGVLLILMPTIELAKHPSIELAKHPSPSLLQIRRSSALA